MFHLEGNFEEEKDIYFVLKCLPRDCLVAAKEKKRWFLFSEEM